MLIGFWKKWLKIAEVIGHFQLRIIFSLFYLIAFSFLGILFHFFLDPLQIKKSAHKESAFLRWNHEKESLLSAGKPF